MGNELKKVYHAVDDFIDLQKDHGIKEVQIIHI